MRRPAATTQRDADYLQSMPDAMPLTETQPLPAVESIADLVKRYPIGCYHHRTRVERIEIPPTRPAREWRREGLERLLSDINNQSR